MKPSDRLFCLFLDNYPPGTTFKQWPLHVTLIPWFRVSDKTLHDNLVSVLSEQSSIRIRATREGQHFGHQPNKLATLIAPEPELVNLEQVLRDYLKCNHAWLVDESVRVRREFIPHITEQGTLKFATGEMRTCNYVYVIEQLGQEKCVRDRILLQSDTT